jgi:hypothetical protein
LENLFAHIWDCADPDGLWDGSAASVAAEFDVTEKEGHAMIWELSDRHRISKIVPGR